MPYGAQIRRESLDRLVQQIGEQLRHIAPPELLNSAPIELRESFELWALGLDSLGHSTHSKHQVRQLARPVGRWHHQIAFGERAAAFARSSSSPSTGQHRLEELFISPLAQAIDENISWLDENTTDGAHVRLLTLPACHLYMLWLERDDLKSRLVVLSSASSPPEERREAIHGFAKFQLYDEGEFLRTLSLAAAPEGVLLAGSPVLTRA